ncbi:hypothetical protein Y032_0053g2323 [Ancylostoma ceylanicum]|uniref:SCP domain-containing protein n=1 Tax=Ancylostoma ceylanicum TaxID=53326 RepID=A0A016U7L1_9BILA|nr:hypothetical protein Y032_0053g2323 [Ancylostoma ceylanicum]
MKTLQRYSCRLELLARRDARKCAETSPPRTGYAIYTEDNYSLVPKRDAKDYLAALEKAIKTWWQKVKTIRPYGPIVALRGYSRDKPTQKFIKMVWARTEEIGCSVNDCGSNYAVVCHYKPGGNRIGEPMYERGAPCGHCPWNCNAHEGLCLETQEFLRPEFICGEKVNLNPFFRC